MFSVCKSLTRAIALGIIFTPLALGASVISELHLTADGKFSAKGLTVTQKAGTTLYTRASWGSAFIRITVFTSSSTAILKNYGEQSKIAEITDNHVIDVDGTLAVAADSLVIEASKIRDTALVKESKVFSGVIAKVNREARSFGLLTASLGMTTVVVPASVPIAKGARTIEFSELAEGDSVISTSGTYDYSSNTLIASSIEIYQDKAIFAPHNFQGMLKSISGSVPPTTLVVSVEGKEYTVNLDKKTAILSKLRQPISLKRFDEGDTVRFFGAIRETNFNEVDAEVVRDLDF